MEGVYDLLFPLHMTKLFPRHRVQKEIHICFLQKWKDKSSLHLRSYKYLFILLQLWYMHMQAKHTENI